MIDNLRALFPEDISDETAYHCSNFLYELALAFESSYFAQIREYHKSNEDFRNEMIEQNSAQSSMNEEQDLVDSEF